MPRPFQPHVHRPKCRIPLSLPEPLTLCYVLPILVLSTVLTQYAVSFPSSWDVSSLCFSDIQKKGICLYIKTILFFLAVLISYLPVCLFIMVHTHVIACGSEDKPSQPGDPASPMGLWTLCRVRISGARKYHCGLPISWERLVQLYCWCRTS